MAWLTLAESRRQTETQKILKDHKTDEKTTVFGPDLGICFSPLKMQQINQPGVMGEGVEIHVLPYDIEDGHQSQRWGQISMSARWDWHLKP